MPQAELHDYNIICAKLICNNLNKLPRDDGLLQTTKHKHWFMKVLRGDCPMLSYRATHAF